MMRGDLEGVQRRVGDEGQGFHFSPPVNAEAFARLLADIPFAIPLLEN